MTPDVATRETVRFVLAHTKRWPAPRVLEIGCGEGEVAAELVAAGASVVAIDASEDAVHAARARGVDAVLATWPHFAGGRFDVVAFTRSLHHIAPLDRAVERAHEVLDAGGRLLVEDFAHDAFDDGTGRWFAGLVRMLDGAGVAFDRDSFCGEVLRSGNGLAAWLADHGHDLHPEQAMVEEIERVFGTVTSEPAPYLYRYVRHGLARGADRGVVETVWQREVMAGRERPGLFIGRRFVAEKR